MENVLATVVTDYELVAGGTPGTLQYYTRAADGNGEAAGIIYKCPCGCDTVSSIPFRADVDRPGPTWNWNGDREKPDVNPSIKKLNGCKWHGFLRNGIWETCADSGQ